VLLARATVAERLAAAVTGAVTACPSEAPVVFTRLHGVASPNTVGCKINIVKTSHFANLFTHCVNVVSNSDCRKRDILMIGGL